MRDYHYRPFKRTSLSTCGDTKVQIIFTFFLHIWFMCITFVSYKTINNMKQTKEQLITEIAKLQARYDKSTGREVYRIGNKLRALKQQLNETTN